MARNYPKTIVVPCVNPSCAKPRKVNVYGHKAEVDAAGKQCQACLRESFTTPEMRAKRLHR